MRRHRHKIHFSIGALSAMQEGMAPFQVKRRYGQSTETCHGWDLCTHLDHLISVKGVGYGASVKSQEGGSKITILPVLKYHRTRGYSQRGTNHLMFVQEVCPLHLLLPHHHFQAPRLRVPFFFFFRTERKRSVAEDEGDEGFAGKRHMKDGGASSRTRTCNA